MQVIITEEEYNDLKARSVTKEDLDKWKVKAKQAESIAFKEVINIIRHHITIPIGPENAERLKRALSTFANEVESYPLTNPKD